MDDEQSDQPRGFRVNDRRRFTDDAAATASEEATAADAPSVAAGDASATHAAGAASGRHDQPLNFSTFVLGLSTQALLHLGEIPDPTSGRAAQDLVAAKQVIDILGLLAAKTTNNLEQDEQSLLDSALYDLRIRYVQLVGASAAKEGS
jgi:hypothetical protein